MQEGSTTPQKEISETKLFNLKQNIALWLLAVKFLSPLVAFYIFYELIKENLQEHPMNNLSSASPSAESV